MKPPRSTLFKSCRRGRGRSRRPRFRNNMNSIRNDWLRSIWNLIKRRRSSINTKLENTSLKTTHSTTLENNPEPPLKQKQSKSLAQPKPQFRANNTNPTIAHRASQLKRSVSRSTLTPKSSPRRLAGVAPGTRLLQGSRSSSRYPDRVKTPAI